MLDAFKEIEDEINLLFNEAEKEKHVHSRSKETFDNIAGLWLLDSNFDSVLAHISSNYIVSSFLLKSLELIYGCLQDDYDLPNFSADLLTDDGKLAEFKESLEKLKSDKKFLDWLQNTLLPRCEELMDYDNARNLEDISKIGNLADSTLYITQRYSANEDGDVWVYDGIFQFSDELKIVIEEPEKFDLGHVGIDMSPFDARVKINQSLDDYVITNKSPVPVQYELYGVKNNQSFDYVITNKSSVPVQHELYDVAA